MERIKRFWMEEEGSTMPEYAIVASSIAALCCATVGLVGSKTAGLFQTGLDAILAAF